MRIKWRSGAQALSALSFVAITLAGPAAAANPVSDLPGRWTGWGSVVLSSGASEKLKCVATYFLKRDGSDIQQNLRCASASYKIDAVANLLLNSSKVSGEWKDRVHENAGSVSGRMTAKGFNLSIVGDGFSAAMAVSTSACKQSISIAPKGFDIQKINIGLGKC